MIDVPVSTHTLNTIGDYHWQGRKRHGKKDFAGACMSYELCDDTITEALRKISPEGPTSSLYARIIKQRTQNRLWWFFALLRMKKRRQDLYMLIINDEAVSAKVRRAVKKAYSRRWMAWWHERQLV